MLVSKRRQIICLALMTVALNGLAQQGEAQDVSSKPPLSEPSPLELLVQKTLSPYLTHPSRRDGGERISLIDQKLEIWRLESFERGDISAKLCAATRALIFGRLAQSKGLKTLFQEAPYLSIVEFAFYRLKTEVNPDLNGQYQQAVSPQITARLSLSRERAQTLDLDLLKSTLSGPTCVSQARDILDDLWISDQTTERRTKLRDAALELRARTTAQPASSTP